MVFYLKTQYNEVLSGLLVLNTKRYIKNVFIEMSKSKEITVHCRKCQKIKNNLYLYIYKYHSGLWFIVSIKENCAIITLIKLLAY